MPDPADPSPPRRHILRLLDYDYALAGAYFVTICTHERACVLGNIVEGQLRISPLGKVVCICWDEIPEHYPGIELDAFAIMPNHLHGIVLIKDRGQEVIKEAGAPGMAGRATTDQVKAPTLGTVIRSFKAAATRTVRQRGLLRGTRLWQPDYYEHILRGEAALSRIREYIEQNPAKWVLDKDNPATWR